MVRVVMDMTGYYIVADALLYPKVNYRRGMEVARVLGGVYTNTNRLSPAFPEKELAEIWWESVSGVSDGFRVRLSDGFIRFLQTRVSVDEVGKKGNIKYIYVYPSVRAVMKLFGVIKLGAFDFECLKPDEYVRVMERLNRVMKVKFKASDVISLLDRINILNGRSIVRVKTDDERLEEIIQKYAICAVDRWYCIRKSNAPEMANELLSVRWQQ